MPKHPNLRPYEHKLQLSPLRPDSSPLKEQQKQGLAPVRGIDFYEGNIKNPDLLLPYGMNTVLTQIIGPGPEWNAVYSDFEIKTEGTKLPISGERDDWGPNVFRTRTIILLLVIIIIIAAAMDDQKEGGVVDGI